MAFEGGGGAAVAGGRAELGLGGAAGHELGGADEDGVADGDGRAVGAPSTRAGMGLSPELGPPRPASGLAGLDEGAPAGGVALAGLAAQALAGALVVAGPPPGPGGQVLGRGDASDRGPHRGAERLGGSQADAGPAVQALDRRRVRTLQLRAPTVEVGALIVQVNSTSLPMESPVARRDG